jgi:hypothetical protein
VSTLERPRFEHICGDLLIEQDIEGTASATFSLDRAYRYMLTRRWGPGPVLTWIMLNPSTADALKDDPTIRACIKFARRDGYGGIVVVNLFALRSPHPGVLAAHTSPVGPLNNAVISAVCGREAAAAWGAGGSLLGRDKAVAGMLAGTDLRCLGLTKDGFPKHPLARGRSRIPDDEPWHDFRLAA